MATLVELAPPMRAAAPELASALCPVYVADTDEEKADIYRFRYAAYVEELHRRIGAADDERRWLHDEQDDQDAATLLCAQQDGEIVGTVRVLRWAPGDIPAAYRETYSMDLFAGLERLTVAELARLVIRPDSRGQLGLVSLLSALFQLYAAELDSDIVFLQCAAGLVRHYRLLGCRTYAGRLVESDAGMHVPLVLFPSDAGYLERVGSPMAPFVTAYYGPGRRAPLDLAPYRQVLDADSAPVQVDADVVWETVSRMRLAESPEPGLLEALDRETVRKLAERGFVLSLDVGQVLAEKGVAEKELYVILDGSFAVHDGERRLRVLGRGDVIGELAFFGTAGRRTATVTAASAGRVLVIRRRFIDQLRRDDPACAADILFQLARVLADRRYAPQG